MANQKKAIKLIICQVFGKFVSIIPKLNDYSKMVCPIQNQIKKIQPQFLIILIINRNMEENQTIMELVGLSNGQYLQRFKSLLQIGQVQKITLFLTFGEKGANQNTKLQRKSLSKINHPMSRLKPKKSINYLFNDFRSSLILQKPLDLKFQIQQLYDSGQYEKILQILTPKEALLSKQINLTRQQTDLSNNQSLTNQYNNVTFNIANSFFRLKQFEKAAEYYNKMAQSEPDKQRAQRMNNLGTCYAIKKSYQLSLKYYNQAIKSYNRCENEDTSSLLNNIAMIYLKCDMLKQAEEYFLTAIQQRMAKSPNNKLMLYNSYYSLGVCQKRMPKLQESLNNLGIAFNYACEGNGNKIEVLKQICDLYQLQQKWCEALSNYQKLSQEYEKTGKIQAIIYERVSKIHEKLGNSILASKFTKQAYKIYQLTGNQRKMSELSSNFRSTVTTF